MKFTRLLSLFALTFLVVLSVGAVSAQVTTCIALESSSFPTSVSNSQGSFTATFVLNNTGIGCTAARNVTGISFTSNLGTTNQNSAWALNTNLPVTLAVGQSSSFSATFTIPSGQSGTLSNSISVSTTTQAGSPDAGSPYTFTLPSVTVTPASTSFAITVQGTQPFMVGQNATLSIANPVAGATLSETGTTLFGITFSPSILTANTNQVLAILNNLQNLKFGINTVNVQAASGSQVATANFQVRKTFCSAGPTSTSNLTIKNIDWSNDGEGDEDEWELLDEIEVEVEVENVNQDDDVDAVVELGFFDNSGRNVADDLEFIGESEEDEEKVEINIDEDDEQTVTFRFKVPADFDTGNYQMAVKVYDDDAGESRACRDQSSDFDNAFFQAIDITDASDEGRFVVVDEFNVDSQVACGQTLTGQFTLFNIGEDDQDRVKVTIRNTELGISESVELTSDLDQGEEETMTFSVRIPSTATNGQKQLEFLTEYDYKNGVYREESDDASVFSVEVIGCAGNLGNPGSSALTGIFIDAELDSEAEAGRELVVIATITNDGDSEMTLDIDADSFSDWAELTDISDDSLSLDAGESKEVTLKFLVNSDASGSQTFDIEVSSAGKVQVQEVEVEIEGSSSNGFAIDFKGNSALWTIGLINLVLIILIIIVAVRLSRK